MPVKIHICYIYFIGNMLFTKVDSNWCFYVTLMLSDSDINTHLLLSDSDFACRNCLVMSDLSVKIGDYGVAEDQYRVCIKPL